MNTIVGEKTNLIGSVIGGGNTTLRTAPLPKIEENEVINKVGVYQWQKK